MTIRNTTINHLKAICPETVNFSNFKTTLTNTEYKDMCESYEYCDFEDTDGIDVTMFNAFVLWARCNGASEEYQG